jgi:hypothetical protein
MYLIWMTIQIVRENVTLDMIDPEKWLLKLERKGLRNRHPREQRWKESRMIRTRNDVNISEI